MDGCYLFIYLLWLIIYLLYDQYNFFPLNWIFTLYSLINYSIGNKIVYIYFKISKIYSHKVEVYDIST